MEENLEEEKTLETEAVEEEEKEHFYNMRAMNCNFKTYKLIRTKHNMPIVEKCRKCNKKFKENDELYSAYLEEERKGCIICKKCAKKE